jgi:hypothetical protein
VERIRDAEGALASLPPIVGHWSGTRLVHGAAEAEDLHLRPEDELPLFVPCRARRWHSGDLVYERLELEGEGEETTRRAYEDRAPLGATKGVAGTLRAAFALAVIMDVSRRTGILCAPLELRAHLQDVAEHGWARAASVLERLRQERVAQEALVRAREAARAAQPAPPQGSRTQPQADPDVQIEVALRGSGARLLGTRRLGDGLVVVDYLFLGERLTAVVRPDSLQVVDAGICVAGHDEELTLHSLPSVVREGAEGGHLVITGHG